MPKTKGNKLVMTINAYQTYIDALNNPYTRKNYEIHFLNFKNYLKASDTCNELLTREQREIEDEIAVSVFVSNNQPERLCLFLLPFTPQERK